MHRQHEGEIGTLAQLTGDFDPTSVRFDDPARDEQAETGAAVVVWFAVPKSGGRPAQSRASNAPPP